MNRIYKSMFQNQNTVNIEKIIDVIQQSDLDQTIKDILIRDVQNEGLTEFLQEQINAYCDRALDLINKNLDNTKQ